jgi:hypothetical protein
MIRITTQMDELQTVVAIDGRMEDSDLGEIRRVRKRMGSAVVLNLDGLDACADTGIRLLKEWLRSGAKLEHANPFLHMLLENREDPDKDQN